MSRNAIFARTFLFAVCSIGSAHAAAPGETQHAVVVTARGGDVAITANGKEHAGGTGSELVLAARIITGADGHVALAQDGTRVTIAANSDVEIPAEAAEGRLVARMIQRSGNVFYDVQKREAGRLRVETPFLVAVIKGTQFNVAVQDGRTTISLFEGLLELRSAEDDEVIELTAGEIAVRTSFDDAIRVIGMDDQVLAPSPASDAVAARTAAAARDAVAAVAAFAAASESAASRTESADGATSADAASQPGTRLDARTSEPTLAIDTKGTSAERTLADLGTRDVGPQLDAEATLDVRPADARRGIGLELSASETRAGVTLGAANELGADAKLDVGGGAKLEVVDATLDLDPANGLATGKDSSDAGVGAGRGNPVDAAGALP